MSSKKIWFGKPTGHMQWVPAPLAGAEAQNINYVDTIEFENGGADVYRSRPYRKQYDFEFSAPIKGSEELGVFNKFASGYYGGGTCIFADPYAFETNLFGPQWATPALIEQGWKNIAPVEPSFVQQLGPTWTNLATNPSFETGSGTVTVNTNLLRNPSFEVDTSSWSHTGTSLTRVTTEAYSGVASAQFVCSAVLNAALITETGLTASLTYTASVWVKGEAGKEVRLDIREATAGGAIVGDTTGTNTLMTGAWQRLSVTRTFGATGERATVLVRNGTSGAHTFFIDAAQLEVGPSATTYFDGSTAAGGDFTYAWSGAANASTSLQQGVSIATTSVVGSVAIQSSGWASSGASSMRVVPNTTLTSNSYARFLVDTVIGQTYTARAKVRLTAAQTGSLNARARAISAWNNSLSTLFATSNQAPNSAGVTDVSVTFTATTTQSSILFHNGASAGNGDVWFDEFIVALSDYSGSYFDGSTTDTSQIVYSWTGTANASTSTAVEQLPTYEQPPKAAVFDITATAGAIPDQKFTIPIPPTHTLHLGASGSTTGNGRVAVRPILTGGTYDSPVTLTMLDPTLSTRMNTTFSGATYQAVEVFIYRTATTPSTLTLTSMMAQLWKTGVNPTLTGDHVPGDGHTGLEFADDARVETYLYINPPRKALSTTLVEVGAWR